MSSLFLAFRERWWVVMAAVVFGLLAGSMVANALGPRFSASLAVRATANENVTSLSGTRGVSTVGDERKQLIFQFGARAPLEELRDELGDDVVDLFVTAPEDSPLLNVTVVATDPDLASEAVDLAVTSIIDERRQHAIEQASVVADRLRDQAESVTPDTDAITAEIAAIGGSTEDGEQSTAPLTPAEAARLEVLRAQLEGLFSEQTFYEQRATEIEFDSLTQPIGIELVGSNVPTVEAAYPTRKHLLALLGVAGFLFGIALLWVLELKKGPRMTDARLTRIYPGVPISGLAARTDNSLETFAVRLIDSVGGGKVIAYIELNQSTVNTRAGSLPLARSFTEIGTVTSVIDCDLRSGSPDSPEGLSSYLTGEIEASELATQSHDRSEPRQISSGPAVLKPLVVARGASMTKLLEALQALSDCVLLAVADPLLVPEVPLLVSDVSEAILEFEPGRVHLSDLDDLHTLLDQLDITVIGLVTKQPQSLISQFRSRFPVDSELPPTEEDGPRIRIIKSSDNEAAV